MNECRDLEFYVVSEANWLEKDTELLILGWFYTVEHAVPHAQNIANLANVGVVVVSGFTGADHITIQPHN